MKLFTLLSSPIILIATFFCAFVVAYYTVFTISERYAFASYQPKNLKRKKVVWAIVSFIVSFTVLILINSLF
jgi:hypothetical protein